QATFSLDDSFHKSLVSDRLRQNPLPQDSDSTSADVSSIHLPVDPFTSANNINGQNSAPRRLGVRFDLDGEKAEQTTSSPRHHLATQLYRDLAGNLKKGPVSSPSACNCVQRQAEYLAGKVSHFVPCSVHAYLDFRASEANPLPPNQPVARKHSERVNPPSKVLTRSRSDESLSVNAKKAGAKPAAPNDSVPVQVEKKPNNTPLSDVCMGSPSTRPISVNYEDASGWFRGEKLNQAPLQHTKAKDESDLPQKVSKSKSYSEQLTVAEATPSAALTNGCSTTTMGRQTVASPLYMSCHNIDGKMGLSVGCGPQAILSAP
uniref:ANK_REP_REGION domain-containing protein n=1 Tax=Mesocestoides corti TaxID=53468 RepID=A0A5K3EGI3_MESCO